MVQVASHYHYITISSTYAASVYSSAVIRSPFIPVRVVILVLCQILSAEGLLACGSWPSLNELIVHGNPLMRATRGIPLLLQTRLVREHGIRIVRWEIVGLLKVKVLVCACVGLCDDCTCSAHGRRPLDSRKRHLIGTAAKDFKKVFIPARAWTLHIYLLVMSIIIL